MKKNSKWLSLLVFIVIIFLVQIIGGLFTASSVNDWYQTLKQPAWSPPDWLFGPVWTILYVMIAFAGWLVYIKRSSKLKRFALLLYAGQLLFNLLWTFFFFYLKSPFLGFIDIVILIVFILGTIISFMPISQVAAYLLFPYLFWTLYASTLNGAIWLMNR